MDDVNREGRDVSDSSSAADAAVCAAVPRDTDASPEVIPPLTYLPPPDVAAEEHAKGPITRQLRHADPDGLPAPASFRYMPNLSEGLIIGIPCTAIMVAIAIIAYRDDQLMASLGLFALALPGLLTIYGALRTRLVANERGILWRTYVRSYRIPWSDLDCIELVDRPRASPEDEEPGTLTEMLFVTVQGERIKPALDGEDGDWLHETAQTLLAMRDEYSSWPDDTRSEAPSAIQPGWIPPVAWGPSPDREPRQLVVVQLRHASDNAVPRKILRARRRGFKADQRGIWLGVGTKRVIRWSDLEGIDFVRSRTGSDSDTRVVLITRGHRRIHLHHLTGSPTHGHKPYEVAQTLLAMRDRYANPEREQPGLR